MREDVIAFGPGKAALLIAISQQGSISAAARVLAMSYRRAWLLVEEMNASFRGPLVATVTGGTNGGGAHITPLAQALLVRYAHMTSKAEIAVAPDMAYFESMMINPDERTPFVSKE